MSTSRPTAIVVGAGIVGAACAAALARNGVSVTIVESDIPAGGTTAAGMGHLVAMDDSPAQLALTALSLERWRALAPTLPVSVELEPTGTLWIAEDDAQYAALVEKQRVYADAGIRAEVLDPQATAEAEPRLANGLAGSLRVPDDSVLYPPAAALALLHEARAHGATERRMRVERIEPHAIVHGLTRLEADFIINAAGARAAELTPGLPIVPRKGHLAITDRYPGFCRHQVVETGYLTSAHVMSTESVAFNVQPRRTGQLLIGSSRELAGWDPSLNRSLLARMLDRAVRFMPSLAGLSVIRTWTGFRPATPDKLPLVGFWEPVPGLLIAAGHEGLGITTATGTAELIASLILGGPTPIESTPFSPMRVLVGAS